MRIEGSRLVVACRRCGVSVVAVGWSENNGASDGASPDHGAPAATSGDMASGRLEFEAEDEPAVSPSPPPIPRPAREDVRPAAGEALRNAKRWPVAVSVSGAAAIACAVLFFAWRARRAEQAPEPKAGESSAAVAPSALTSTPPAAPTNPPAAPSSTPAPRPEPTAPSRSAPPERAPKTPAATPIPVATTAPPADTRPAAMSEEQALSSGLVDAEDFQDRTGKLMTHLLFCRNLELARNPGVSLGPLDVTLLVSPSGAVAEVRLDRASGRSSVGRCVRDHLAKLEFPNATGRAVEIRRRVEPGAAERQGR